MSTETNVTTTQKSHRSLGRAICIDSPFYIFAKRLFDIIFSLIALILLIPLFLVVSIAIKIDSPGPLLFWQYRLGKDGKPFRFYKFRSMTSAAPDLRADLAKMNEASGPVFKIRRDPRMTRVGRFIRKYSIDELPQLMHVLTGEMSLVGPRPPIPHEVEQYEAWQRERQAVKPGLTCIWQVSGRSDLTFEQWVNLDVQYVRTRNFWLDLKLLVLTIPAVITGRGAY